MDAPRRRINRNIVECKVELMMNAAKEYIVLIETSWNVKSNDVIKAVQTEVVLIETSWNVKPNWWYYIIIKGSTNRNIVECKVWNCSSGSSSVLIETSWNVKRYVAVIVAEPVFCINRNIVECKVALSMLPAKAPAY